MAAHLAKVRPSAALFRPGIAATAETGEDLPTNRVVPVAERAPAGRRVRTERPAAQDLVVGAEEHLGVLQVGKRAEPRVAMEVAARPLPHIPDELAHTERRRPCGICADGCGL